MSLRCRSSRKIVIEFQQWQGNEEFTQPRGKRKIKDLEIIYFNCNRSGKFTNKYCLLIFKEEFVRQFSVDLCTNLILFYLF